jgi:glycosyltransferase involved in cell wall biosynthesis
VEVHRLFGEQAEVLGRSRKTLGDLRANVRSLAHSLGPISQVARAIRRSRADIVHTNSLKTHVLGGIAARLCGRPLIWDVRDILPPGPARRMLLAVARLTRPHVVAMSQAVADFLGPAGCPTTVVHGGRSPEHFVRGEPGPGLREELGLGPDDLVIVVVARLTPWKGHMVLLDAFRAIHREHPRARLLIVGAPTFWETGYEAELRERAEELGCGEAVRWLGFREDIPELLALSDLMVLPSDTEPFGIAIVEAMIAGKPVVVCDTGGPREIVVEGGTGLVVPTWQVGPLADAIDALLSDPVRARRMGEAGRARALEHFDIRQGVRRIEELYVRLVDGRKR